MSSDRSTTSVAPVAVRSGRVSERAGPMGVRAMWAGRVVRSVAVIAALAIGSQLAACGGGEDPARADATESSTDVDTAAALEPGGEIRIAKAEPTAIDPDLIVDTGGYEITRLLYTPLVAFDPDLKIVPGVATEWEVSDDGLQYTFHLGESRFSNGRAVTAEDFAYSFRRQVDPDTAADPNTIPIVGWDEAIASPPTGEVGDVELPGVEAPDDQTLIVTLTEPYSLLLSNLADVYFAPLPAELLATEEQAGVFADEPVGNGPYKMAEPWAHNESIVLDRNPDHTGEPGLADRIVFEIFAETQTGYREVQAGNLDLSSVPPGQIASARAEFGERYLETESAFVIFIAFHLGAGQPYDDAELRRALSLAMDREALAERVAQGAAVPATGFSPPKFPGAAAEPCDYLDHDPERAKKLYDASGGLPDDTLVAYYPAGVGFDDAVGVVGNDLRSALGIEASFTPVEFTQLIAMQQEGLDGPYGFGWASSLPSAYGFLQPFGETTGSVNDGYDNPEFDALMADVRAAGTPDEADELLQQAQEIACDDMPAIPLVFSSDSLVHSSRIANVVVDGLGTQRLELFAVVE